MKSKRGTKDYNEVTYINYDKECRRVRPRMVIVRLVERKRPFVQYKKELKHVNKKRINITKKDGTNCVTM